MSRIVKKLEWTRDARGVIGVCGRFEYRVFEPSMTPGWRVFGEMKDVSGMASVGGFIVTLRAADEIAAMEFAQQNFDQAIEAVLV